MSKNNISQEKQDTNSNNSAKTNTSVLENTEETINTEINVNEITKNVEKALKEVEKIKDTMFSHIIWVFWIFGSIIAYLSFQIPIFSSICDSFRMVWITSIIFWTLFWFIVGLFLLSKYLIDKPEKNWRVYWISIWVSIISIWAWIFCFYQTKDSEITCKEKPYQNLQSYMQEKTIQNTKLKEEIDSLKIEIEKLKILDSRFLPILHLSK